MNFSGFTADQSPKTDFFIIFAAKFTIYNSK